jgi:uncharacterized protein (DUF2235 family)
MAGGRNKPTTPLPAWLLEANAERREAERLAEVQRWTRRPDRSVHCWVWGSGNDGAMVQLPGLVLEWRRVGAGWMAFVTWTRAEGDFVTDWLDAEQLEPLLVKAGDVWVAADDL